MVDLRGYKKIKNQFEILRKSYREVTSKLQFDRKK